MDTSSGPLSADGVDFTNATQAADFLDELLDDSDFQPIDSAIAKAFWYGIVIVIGIAALINVYHVFLTRTRLRAAERKVPYPASPQNFFTKSMATATAIVREVSYRQYAVPRLSSVIQLPTMGTVIILLVYLGFIIGLEFYNNVTAGAQYSIAIGLRAAWVTIAQFPLLILLAGKSNLIGFVTGVSYERLNIFHRWVGRIIWLTATIHWAALQTGWSEFPLDSLEKSTDYCYPTGVAAWTLLTWMNVSSIAPLRNWQYEFFVVQHIIIFIAFTITVIFHIPVIYARVYIYIPIGFYLFDRLVRSLRYAYNNSRLGRATITALPGGVSKIHVKSSRLVSWTAGQHVFISLPRFGFLQSHPATILSTPKSHGGDLIFILKAHAGFTKRLLTSATSSTMSLLPSKVDTSTSDTGETALPPAQKYVALISGPYGSSCSDFAAFSSALLISGSTGITFTLPILLSIAERAQKSTLPLRRLSFVWIVKSATWTTWVSDELRTAIDSLQQTGIDCDANIFITCDDAMTNLDSTNPSAIKASEKDQNCNCTNKTGPCCCTTDVAPETETSKVTAINEKSLSSSQSSVRTNNTAGFATQQSGRPAIEDIIWNMLDHAEGETGIAVCGPLGLNVRCRNAVSKASEERGVHKGTGAQGVYLHVEGFGW